MRRDYDLDPETAMDYAPPSTPVPSADYRKMFCDARVLATSLTRVGNDFALVAASYLGPVDLHSKVRVWIISGLTFDGDSSRHRHYILLLLHLRRYSSQLLFYLLHFSDSELQLE